MFDRLFHLTRGGVSKASKIINLSEDIFAGIFRIFRFSDLLITLNAIFSLADNLIFLLYFNIPMQVSIPH